MAESKPKKLRSRRRAVPAPPSCDTQHVDIKDLLEDYQVTAVAPETEKCERQDGGKLRYSLLPVEALRLDAQVYTKGAQKYSPNNWRAGNDYSVALDAMMRHLEAYRSGEDIDPASDCHHLAAVRFWCAALIEWKLTGVGVDDRVVAPHHAPSPDAVDPIIKNIRI